jgi:hypothetical protein
MTFTPPKKPYQYPDRLIDCQVSMDGAFRDLWDRSAEMGWGPEEIAAALYELTDNHLAGLRENETLENWFLNIKSRE